MADPRPAAGWIDRGLLNLIPLLIKSAAEGAGVDCKPIIVSDHLVLVIALRWWPLLLPPQALGRTLLVRWDLIEV